MRLRLLVRPLKNGRIVCRNNNDIKLQNVTASSFSELRKEVLSNPQVKQQISSFLDLEIESNKVELYDSMLNNNQTNFNRFMKACKTDGLYLSFQHNSDPQELPTFPFEKKIKKNTPIIWLDTHNVIFKTLPKSVSHDIYSFRNKPIIHNETMKWNDSDWKLLTTNYSLKEHSITIRYREEVIEKINQWSDVAEVKFFSHCGHWVSKMITPQIGLKKIPATSYDRNNLDLEDPLVQTDLLRPIYWINSPPECRRTSKEFKMGTAIMENARKLKFMEPQSEYGLVLNDFAAVDEFIEECTTHHE